MNRLCPKCNTEKPASTEFFASRSGRQDVFQLYCRDCQRQYRKEHYQANKQKYVDKAVKWRNEQKLRVIEYLKTHPCVDCGEDDLRVLQFDHRDPQMKSFGISKAIGAKAWDELVAEINKCDVRCSNCHIKRTSEQFNWLKRSSQLAL